MPILSALFPQDVASLKIPSKWGTIEEFHQGSKSETVIIVQDAHSIPDAQLSLQKIIKHFQNTYGLRKIALEGASKTLDPQILRSFPDQDLLRQILKSYHVEGELAGGTSAAIFNESEDAVYQGVEDWALYEQNLNALSASRRSEQKKFPQKLKTLEKIFKRRKPKVTRKNCSNLTRS